MNIIIKTDFKLLKQRLISFFTERDVISVINPRVNIYRCIEFS